MTDYERGLADAAKICRSVAQSNAPWRGTRFEYPGHLGSFTILNRKERARGAIRCARAIERALEWKDG